MADFHGMKVAQPGALPDPDMTPGRKISDGQPILGSDAMGQLGTAAYSFADSASLGGLAALLANIPQTSEVYKRLEASRKKNQIASITGDVGGMFMPTGLVGAGAKLAQGGFKLAGMADKAAKAGKVAEYMGKGGKTADTVGKAAVHGLASAAEQAVPRAITGTIENPEDAMAQGIGGALGVAGGGGLGAAGKALSKVQLPAGMKRIVEGFKNTKREQDSENLMLSVGNVSQDMRTQLNEDARRMGLDPLGYSANKVASMAEDYPKFLANRGIHSPEQAEKYIKEAKETWDLVEPRFPEFRPSMRDPKFVTSVRKDPKVDDYIDHFATKGETPGHPGYAEAVANNKRVLEAEIYNILKKADGVDNYWALKQNLIGNNIEKFQGLRNSTANPEDHMKYDAMVAVYKALDARLRRASKEVLNEIGDQPGFKPVSTSLINGPNLRLGDQLSKEWPYINMMERGVVNYRTKLENPLESSYGTAAPQLSSNTAMGKGLGTNLLPALGVTAGGVGATQSQDPGIQAMGLAGTVGGGLGLASSMIAPRMIPSIIQKMGNKASAKSLATEGPMTGATNIPFMPKPDKVGLGNRISALGEKLNLPNKAGSAPSLREGPIPTQDGAEAPVQDQQAPVASGDTLQLPDGTSIQLPGPVKLPEGPAKEMIATALQRNWNLMDPEKYSYINPQTGKEATKQDYIEQVYRATNGFDPLRIAPFLFANDQKAQDSFNANVKKSQSIEAVGWDKMTGTGDSLPGTMNPLSGFDRKYKQSMMDLVELLATSEKASPNDSDRKRWTDWINNLMGQMDVPAEEKKRIVLDKIRRGANSDLSQMQAMGISPTGEN